MFAIPTLVGKRSYRILAWVFFVSSLLYALRVSHPLNLDTKVNQRVEIAMVDSFAAGQNLKGFGHIADRIDGLASVDAAFK